MIWNILFGIQKIFQEINPSVSSCGRDIGLG